jgi:hypothetical protein
MNKGQDISLASVSSGAFTFFGSFIGRYAR